jgi:hypothetical protein
MEQDPCSDKQWIPLGGKGGVGSLKKGRDVSHQIIDKMNIAMLVKGILQGI